MRDLEIVNVVHDAVTKIHEEHCMERDDYIAAVTALMFSLMGEAVSLGTIMCHGDTDLALSKMVEAWENGKYVQ